MQVVAAGHLGPGGCDESASLVLTYSRGRTATLATSSRVNLPNEVGIRVGNDFAITGPYPLGYHCRNEGNTEAAPVLDGGGAAAQ